MLREIASDEQNLSVNWPVMFDEALVQSQARQQGRRLHDRGNDIDGKLAQFDVSSLHGEAVGIQRMPTWNSCKSQDTTKLLFENKCAQSVHGMAPDEFLIQDGEHDSNANTLIKLSQRQKKKWPSLHSLKHCNFLDQGRHPKLVIRRLTPFVVVGQFCGKVKRLHLNRNNLDTKITGWMCSTSRRVQNLSTMSGICNQITNLAQECRHILEQISSSRSLQQRTWLYRYWTILQDTTSH